MHILKKILKVVGVTCSGIAVVFGLAEVGLRITKYLRTAPVVVKTFGPSVIRIVTLGESTTARCCGRGSSHAWPEQLEARLNEWLGAAGSVHRVQVSNIARSGSWSPFQVSALYERSAELNPDILITMLGVNDTEVISAQNGIWFQNLYVIKFLYWAQVAWLCPACYEGVVPNSFHDDTRPVSEAERSAEQAGVQIFLATKFRSSADVEKFASEVSRLQYRLGANQHRMNASVAQKLQIAAMATGTDPSRSSSHKYIAAQAQMAAMSEKLFHNSYREMVLTHSQFLMSYCYIESFLKKDGCLKAIKEALVNGLSASPQLLSFAAMNGARNDPDVLKVFRSLGLEFSEVRSNSTSIHQSFRRLQHYVEMTRAIWFAMQYPTGSIEALKYYMSEESATETRSFIDTFYMPKSPFVPKFQDVAYIDNEIFQTFLRNGQGAQYFEDFFARGWGLNFGHTTKMGHTVIADNVFNTLKGNWPRVLAKIEARRSNFAQ